jgi:hypothetical protein
VVRELEVMVYRVQRCEERQEYIKCNATVEILEDEFRTLLALEK